VRLLDHRFEEIISLENLLDAWNEFLRGKQKKSDVQEFQAHLMDNIIALHQDLANHNYRHGGYQAFKVNDPKPRDIHKASVRDRLLHHAIYRILYPFFDKRFIADSFSCRLDKGTHKALDRFRTMASKVSKNHRRTCWVLKLDVRKFFANIDQTILLDELKKHIVDKETLWLLSEIIGSFSSTRPGVGLPLGNLTSQLFVNIYMNVFDQFVKHQLKINYYIRYADDFVLFSTDWLSLLGNFSSIDLFLQTRLHLNLHPKKIFLRTLASGVDFLGWVHFPDHRVLRTATKHRMKKRLQGNTSELVIQSYLGLLSHGNASKLQQSLRNDHWVFRDK